MTYTQCTLGLLATSLAMWPIIVKQTTRRLVALRVATFGTFISVPWDYFIVSSGAVAYPDPGLVMFGIPVNDLGIVFAMTLFGSSLLQRD